MKVPNPNLIILFIKSLKMFNHRIKALLNINKLILFNQFFN